MEELSASCPPGIIINEVQLILRKREPRWPACAPASRFSLSRSRSWACWWLHRGIMRFSMCCLYFIPVMVFNLLLLALGCYLVVRAIIKLRREDRMIRDIKRKHSAIAEFID